MANKYVIGKAPPGDEPVRVWVEDSGYGAVALRVGRSGCERSIAALHVDGTLTLSAMDESAARTLGLHINATGKIVVV